jgi:uncharacterized SAM-binding protein YcdF (DUF218 family)
MTFGDWFGPATSDLLRPALTALLLPPLPLLLLAVWGGWRARAGKAGGLAAVLVAVAGLWACTCAGLVEPLAGWLLDVPAPLRASALAAIAAGATQGRPAAIVVLGGGVEDHAPEWEDAATLAPRSAERLRYGVWLARRSGLPLAFSGGLGHAQSRQHDAEADVAAGIAREQYGLPLRWVEARSRDTRENAALTVPMLAGQGVRAIVLVTDGWHMPRAQALFAAEAARQSPPLAVHAAPMGLARIGLDPLLRWLPSNDAATLAREVLREVLARQSGA